MAGHPAKMMWLVCMVCCLLAVAFTTAAAVVPQWSRIIGSGGLAPLIASGALTTKVSSSVDAYSVLYIGHWRWCLWYGDKQYSQLCSNTSPDWIPAFANSQCTSQFYASRHTTWISGLMFFAGFIVATLVFLNVNSYHPGYAFKPATAPAFGAVAVCFLALVLSITAWACWIALAEESCRGTATEIAWNPIQGYSSSFIFMCCATFFGILATTTALLGLMKLKKVPQALPIKEQVYEVHEVPVMQAMESPYVAPVTYPAAAY